MGPRPEAATDVTSESLNQLLSGSATFVDPQSVNVAPGVLVKLNWNEPLPSFAVLVRVMAVVEAGV